MTPDEPTYPPSGSRAYPPPWTAAIRERAAEARTCRIETCVSLRSDSPADSGCASQRGQDDPPGPDEAYIPASDIG
jgi:hypothetical protein